MKNILTSALLLIGVSLFAQTNVATTTTVQTSATASLTPKAKAMCHNWVLSQTENFGDVHKPTDAQKKDVFMLMESGRYRLIYNGSAEGGSWTLDKTNTWLTLTNDDGTTKKFKVIEATDKSLKIDYKDNDDVHNILYYSL